MKVSTWNDCGSNELWAVNLGRIKREGRMFQELLLVLNPCERVSSAHEK